MRRRTVLRRGLGTVALTVPLAGCGNSDDGTDDEDDEDDNGEDESPETATGTSTPENGGSGVSGDIPGTAGSTPDGLEIVSTAASVEPGPDGDRLVILVELRNVGDRTTDATEYRYSAEIENDAGDASGGIGGSWTPANAVSSEIGPGETTTVEFTPLLNGDPTNVTAYTISLECTDFWDGSYCSASTASGS